MSNILERLREQSKQIDAPNVVKVTTPDIKEVLVESESEEIASVQPIVSAEVIKQNDPGVPMNGFTMEILADEIAIVLEKAMHKSGVNSFSKETFGLFGQLGIVPKNFELIKDRYTEREFYVLKNSNRMTEIFKSLVRALGSSNSDTVSFPYLTEAVLELPQKYNHHAGDFDYEKIKVTSLYLTPDEITGLNYKFIKEIQFCKTSPELEGNVDLLVMKVDREEWKAAPYRV